ncbi:MAG: hypothetical protein IPJ09_14590 [Saprospiraceae bacterium]|nr:hypothetical protein [Saprospiraceae bacterium]
MFTLKHNAICDELIQHHQGWSDDQLFHTARLINAALMAKIHTIEWNSAINPNPAIYKGNHSNWYGLLTMLKHKRTGVRSHLSISAIQSSGVVGNPIKRFGRDFGLTEEFVEAYRIHSMLPETLEIRDIHSKQMMADIPFTASRHIGAAACSLVFIGKHIFISVLDKILSLTQHRPDFHSGKFR